MATEALSIIDRAIGWHIRQAEMDGGAWAEFVAWLEASPAHASAYDRVATLDRLLPDLPAIPFAANDDAPRPRRWIWNVGGTAIAAGVAALLLPMVLPHSAQPYEFHTKVGERRTVQLADGTRIEMSGDTRLGLDHANMRVASLESGEAVFHVRHDARDPFTLRSGALTVRDVGTVFDVIRAGPQLDVAVAEGSVMFEPKGDAILLKPGQKLTAREDNHSVTLSSVAPDLVGSWRDGRLSFAGEPLSSVFDSLHRAYGVQVKLEGDLPTRPFTGMVAVTGAGEKDIPHLAALIGATWRRSGDQWILAPGATGAR